VGVHDLWFWLHNTLKLVYRYGNSTQIAQYQLTAEYWPCCMSANAAVAHFCRGSQHASADNVEDPPATLTTASQIQHIGTPHMVNNP
jgi:hypothetical protein